MDEPVKRDRSGRYLRKVNLRKDGIKLANILSRDIDHLLAAVKERQLSTKETATLCAYIKLWGELNARGGSGVRPEEVTDAQLEAIAGTVK